MSKQYGASHGTAAKQEEGVHIYTNKYAYLYSY
jgi:hypothetical protein